MAGAFAGLPPFAPERSRIGGDGILTILRPDLVAVHDLAALAAEADGIDPADDRLLRATPRPGPRRHR